MKKLLFVINTLGMGGAERALLDLLDSIAMEECSLDLLVLLPRGELFAQVPKSVHVLNRRTESSSVLDGAGRRALARETLACFFRGGGLIAKLGSVLRAVPPMLRHGRVQLDKLLWRVISDGTVPPQEIYDEAVAWTEGGAAYFVAEHVRAAQKVAVFHIDYEQSGYSRALDRGCWDHFDKIFCVSQESTASFVRAYPEYRAKVEMLPNRINQERIRRLAREPGGFADGYEGARLLSVGRLTHQKAFDVAIEAMRLLKGAGCRARWYVLGEGELREKLERQIAARGLREDFVLLGTVANPYPYFAGADVYVHATRFEGRSIAVQEALTLGCAIVASDVSGNHSMLEHERNGLLCALRPEAVAEAVRRLLNDPALRKRLGEAAKKQEMPDKEAALRLLEGL